jgi:mRNA degradation ribonuclease J1/J2
MALSQDGFVIARVNVSPEGHIIERPEIVSQALSTCRNPST